MRADLPAAIGELLGSVSRPTLAFDAARIAENLARFAAVGREVGATVLFAAKSFPRAEVWALAADALDGFDAASPGEVAALPPARVVSIADPTGAALASVPRAARVLASCETPAQIAAAPPGAELALRVSMSTGRDPALGAILDGTGHRRSRFGVSDLRVLAAAARGRRVGLHVHHGPLTAATGARFADTARDVLALAAAAEVEPAFLDLGGAWHGLADPGAALRELRAAIPAGIELVVEPGRLFAAGAGFALGRVAAVREEAGRVLRVCELSRLCHLRWSPVELVGRAPHPGDAAPSVWVGPTCSEDDALGEWPVARAAFAAGDAFALRGATGYAVAWNTGFGGVPPADVVFVS
ncbi:MAG TPA: hypothetical protein VGM88_19970 [Kofleriaceae bacterium]